MDSCIFYKPHVILRHNGCKKKKKTRDRPQVIMLEHRCWKQEHWSGIVIWSLSVFACVFYHAPVTWEMRVLLGGRPGITLDHIHISPLTSRVLYCLEWMQESAAAGLCPDNIILKLQELSVLHLFMHAAEKGDWTFSIYNAPWVSRLQVITVKCWICWWGEHYNHVFPDKAVLKQTKSCPLPSSPHRPRSLIELMSMQMLCF